ncbi:hypothetical protein B0H13DRAFT_2266302 [Mycena leptocephala]|nr:hypothetical protein B0H13DRAFT_2266302 [Mycena leptocephala]
MTKKQLSNFEYMGECTVTDLEVDFDVQGKGHSSAGKSVWDATRVYFEIVHRLPWTQKRTFRLCGVNLSYGGRDARKQGRRGKKNKDDRVGYGNRPSNPRIGGPSVDATPEDGVQAGACGGLGGYGRREEVTERMWATRDADVDAARVVDDAHRALCHVERATIDIIVPHTDGGEGVIVTRQGAGSIAMVEWLRWCGERR